MKNPRTNHTTFFQCFPVFPLLLENFSEFICEWEFPCILVFGASYLKVNPLILKIDLCPFQVTNFTLSPSRKIRKSDKGFKVIG